MISDLQKSCKHSAESSLIPLTHLSLMFTYSITIIQLSKLYINIGIIVLTKLQTLFKYHQFFKLIYMSVPGSTEDPTLYLIYSSLPVCDFFILSFYFMTLTPLKNSGQLFCKVSFNLSLSNVLS